MKGWSGRDSKETRSTTHLRIKTGEFAETEMEKIAGPTDKLNANLIT